MDTKILNINDLRKIISCISRTKINDSQDSNEAGATPPEVSADVETDDSELNRVQAELRAQESIQISTDTLTKGKIIEQLTLNVKTLKQLRDEYRKELKTVDSLSVSESMDDIDTNLVHGIKVISENYNALASASGLPKMNDDVVLPFKKSGHYYAINTDNRSTTDLTPCISAMIAMIRHNLMILKR